MKRLRLAVFQWMAVLPGVVPILVRFARIVDGGEWPEGPALEGSQWVS